MIEIINNDKSILENKDYYILFYFTASWCGPCRKIKPLLEKLSDGLDKSKVVFAQVDIDINDELSDEFNIQSVPSFLLFYKEKLIDQCSGANILNVHKLLKKNMK